MAYKQPRVPPMQEGGSDSTLRELILFLKDFCLETWMAVKTMQGAVCAPEEPAPETVTPGEVQALLSAQAQALRGEMEALASETRREAIDGALPVGVVVSFATQTDPNALYPWQAWTRIADGRVEIAANAAHPLGSTGGEEQVTLTSAQMPSHRHTHLNIANHNLTAWSGSGSGNVFDMSSLYKTNTYNNNYFSTGYTGGGQPHNNMPPYVARNVWQRTQ